MYGYELDSEDNYYSVISGVSGLKKIMTVSIEPEFA